MARIWYPSICPSGQCAIALAEGADDHPDNVVGFLCSHHQSVKNRRGLDDAGILRVLFQSSRVKEAARWAAKVALGLHKDHPGVQCRVNSDGSFSLLTAPGDLEWRLGDSAGPLPTISTADRDRAADSVEIAVSSIDSPTGTSTVRRLT